MGSAEQRVPGSGVILTPDQRVRVFISSTLEELAAERAPAPLRCSSSMLLLPRLPALPEFSFAPSCATSLSRWKRRNPERGEASSKWGKWNR